MDWQRYGATCSLLICAFASHAFAWSRAYSPEVAVVPPAPRHLNEVSPYIDLALCPIRPEPWSCARQQSGRILDVWDGELNVQWQKLKVEADQQLNATIEKRGYSASELPIKEKPSTILKKLEIGSKYMKEYLAETMDGFLGREYEYLQTSKAADDSENDNHIDNDDDDNEGDDDEDEEGEDEESDTPAEEADDEESEEDDDDTASAGGGGDDDDPEPEEVEENESSAHVVQVSNQHEKNTVFSGGVDNISDGIEFIELEEGEQTAPGALKKPGGGGGKRKRKQKNKKKKGQQQQQPATLVVVQQASDPHDVGGVHDHGHGHGGDDSDHSGAVAKPLRRKQKRGRRKKKGQHATVVVEPETSDHLGLGLLDELVDGGELLGFRGKRKHRNPIKYGRSNGVTRGKKKKKKKALMKLALAASFLKAKIELLLKILGAHLQIKFFAIALIGLLINIARFWIDVKRGGAPSKVVYVEHAHHQHHYEDHGDDWNEQGSYWKRSLQTDPSIEDTADSATDSYQVRTPYQQQQQQQTSSHDPHYMAYRNQYQWQ